MMRHLLVGVLLAGAAQSAGAADLPYGYRQGTAGRSYGIERVPRVAIRPPCLQENPPVLLECLPEFTGPLPDTLAVRNTISGLPPSNRRPYEELFSWR